MIDVDISVARIKQTTPEDLWPLARRVLAECPYRKREFADNLRRAVDERDRDTKVLWDAVEKICGGDLTIPAAEMFKRAGLPPKLMPTWKQDVIEAAKRFG